MTCRARSSTVTAAIACALAALVACQRASEPPAPRPNVAPSNSAAPAASFGAQTLPATPDAASASAAPTTADSPSAPSIAPTVDFSVPRTVAAGKAGDILFTIAEVATEPRNSESMRLVLLVRMQNKQRQAADFADENFRLVTQDSVIAANGGLGETIGAGMESALERVQFVVPINSVPRALKIELGGESTELPLTFKR